MAPMPLVVSPRPSVLPDIPPKPQVQEATFIMRMDGFADRHVLPEGYTDIHAVTENGLILYVGLAYRIGEAVELTVELLGLPCRFVTPYGRTVMDWNPFVLMRRAA